MTAGQKLPPAPQVKWTLPLHWHDNIRHQDFSTNLAKPSCWKILEQLLAIAKSLTLLKGTRMVIGLISLGFTQSSELQVQ